MMIKELFVLSLFAVVCVNTMKAQWICEVEVNHTVFGGDESEKIAYSNASNASAQFKIKEYINQPVLDIEYIPLYLIIEDHNNRGIVAKHDNSVAMMEIWFKIGAEWKIYKQSGNKKEGMVAEYFWPFSSLDRSIYFVSIYGDIGRAFWSDFKQSNSVKIRLKDFDSVQEVKEYEFDMKGSSKAYNYVLGGKIPTWDK